MACWHLFLHVAVVFDNCFQFGTVFQCYFSLCCCQLFVDGLFLCSVHHFVIVSIAAVVVAVVVIVVALSLQLMYTYDIYLPV